MNEEEEKHWLCQTARSCSLSASVRFAATAWRSSCTFHSGHARHACMPWYFLSLYWRRWISCISPCFQLLGSGGIWSPSMVKCQRLSNPMPVHGFCLRESRTIPPNCIGAWDKSSQGRRSLRTGLVHFLQHLWARFSISTGPDRRRCAVERCHSEQSSFDVFDMTCVVDSVTDYSV